MSVNWKPLSFAVLLALLVIPARATDLTLPATGDVRVQVRFVQTENFATTNYDREPDKWRDAMLTELGKYTQKAVAPRLAAGQSLQIDILDLKRAGSAGRAGGPRIIRETDPPRIDLAFRVLDASGAVVREEKKRQLRDMDFLTHGDYGDSDPLVYEKRLLDDWVDRDFPAPKK